MAILSASRKTDIPCHYGEWFMNHLRKGSFVVRNEKSGELTRYKFSRKDIDCIVFWTKNPANFLQYLPLLKDYPYYFQYSITGYGQDIEPNAPMLDERIRLFKELHDKGNGQVVWRYDPILFSFRTDEGKISYNPEWHIEAFQYIASALKGYTDECIISFIDTNNLTPLGYRATSLQSPLYFMENVGGFPVGKWASRLAEIAHKNGMQINTCAEKINLNPDGVGRASCIDIKRIDSITGKTYIPPDAREEKEEKKANPNWHPECDCFQSIDIGAVNTCADNCLYCYANRDPDSTKLCHKKYKLSSPLLCETLGEKNICKEVKLQSIYIKAPAVKKEETTGTETMNALF